MHTHGDVAGDGFDKYLAMGVTTIAVGQDGSSAQDESDTSGGDPNPLAALSSWLTTVSGRGTQVNVAPFSGHGSLRRLAGIPASVRRPDAAQLAQLQAILAADLAAGSFGLTLGLEYVPGRYAEPAELTALAAVVAGVDGIILSHMRSEDDGLIEGAIDELVMTGGAARVHISHLKILYAKGPAVAQRLLRLIAEKQAAGARLSADIYPYTAGYTGISILFPEWALPPNDYKAVVAGRREELLTYLRARMIRRGGPEALLIGSKPYAGRTLAQVATAAGRPFEEVLLTLGPNGADGAHFLMDEALQDVLLASPVTAISTDGGPGLRHPRGAGTYARLIETFVHERKLLTLPQAIHKATGLPASLLRLKDRGVIRAGAYADILLFDPAKVHAAATYENPWAPAVGFDFVLVNGRVAFTQGRLEPGRYGSILRPPTEAVASKIKKKPPGLN